MRQRANREQMVESLEQTGCQGGNRRFGREIGGMLPGCGNVEGGGILRGENEGDTPDGNEKGNRALFG